MNSYGFGVSLIGIMIIFGIIVSGSVNDAVNNPDNIQYFKDNNILPPNFNNLLEQLDVNLTNQIDGAFADSNISPGMKLTVHYITKGMIYGIYTDLYIGQSINEYLPWMYNWVKENIFIVIAILILLIYPELVTILFICIFAGILILKEKYIDKPKQKKTEWREK